MSAHSEHGVLTVELPKKAAAQPKQIKVNVTAPVSEQGSAEGKTVEGEANQPAATRQNAESKPAQA